MPTRTTPLCCACISVALGCRFCLSSIHKTHRDPVSPRGGNRAEVSSGDLGVTGLQVSGDRGQNANCGHEQQEEFQLFHHSSLLGELLLKPMASRCPYQHKIKILTTVTGPEGKTKHSCWILAHHKPQMLFRICTSHL